MKKHLINNISGRATAVIMLLLIAATAFSQNVIRLTGQVLVKTDHSPAIGVNIVDTKTKRALAVTDEDGKFAFNVMSNAKLRFSMVGLKTKEVNVNGKLHITVTLEEENVSLNEVTISQKRITDKIMPEPTDIEVHGNYFHVKTRVRVPKQMFAHDTRLVVQPVLNNVTRKKIQLMKPMVYDAKEYNQTQDRLYNFDLNNETAGDPLAKFITVKSKNTKERGRSNDIIGYTDSIYVENMKDEYSCDIYMAIENYNRILYRDTTSIAHGTVNPLRFLDYSFAAHQLTDSAFMPKPEAQLRDSKGEVRLHFPVGKAEFNTRDANNAAEIGSLRSQIETISHSKGATLNSLELNGQASPEGIYEQNRNLAEKRMDFALRFLRKQLPQSMQQGMEFKSKAEVASWQDVANLIHADNLTAEASSMENIIAKNKGIDLQSRAMKRLPNYRSLIAAKYLPMLRRVEYTLHYSIYRTLTKEEIQTLYDQDYKQLSKFEFFKLYRSETDSTKRIGMMKQALEVYPSFTAAANDLAAEMINSKQSDATILAKFAGANAPQEVNTNQMIALMDAGKYQQADSVAQFVDDNADTHLLLAMNAALNGKYDESYTTIAKTGIQNEVVMLLAMKRNNEALRVSRTLPDDKAMTHYLRAVCLNRTDNVVEADKELKQALAMDPSLKEVAKVDGDVNDLLSLDKEEE